MTTPPTIFLSPVLTSFATRRPHGHVQFDWWSSATPSVTHREHYALPQSEWARFASPEIVALAATHPELAGYWSDAAVEAEAMAYLATHYGFTNIAIAPDPVQPDVPVAKTTLEKAAVKVAATPTDSSASPPAP